MNIFRTKLEPRTHTFRILGRKKAPRENPRSLVFTVFIRYYSITVATRPDPTVRPHSRYFNPVLSHIFYGFLSKMQ